ncbi:MAG: excinuclease ABC subunit UvrB [Rikenellaceae bacterium]
MEFKLVSQYEPTGDQPEAIRQLIDEVEGGSPHSTLWGVTGSGKTFTMANVINHCNRPTLILSHNKTLAAQLYEEFKAYFPENRVEYFVSYYDYYQPEAYLPKTDTYIEKDLAINEELEKLRLSTTSALLSGRRDLIVVSSVSCLYGMGNPSDFKATTILLRVGTVLGRTKFINQLTTALYSRSEVDFSRGTFRVKGDTIDVFLAYGDIAYRISFYDEEVERITTIDPLTGAFIENNIEVTIFPATIFVTTKERMHRAIAAIQDDMLLRFNELMEYGKSLEANRLKSKVEYDLEMIKEIGYCSGIENYSRYFDGREPGSRPFCLLDYFPKDYILFIDESHVTLPQVKAMYGGDFSRKTNLVEYGFRLPAAIDNRPLKFDEFESMINQVVYVSATPSDYELIKSEGVVIEQAIRPTGLLDPPIEVVPTDNQIDRVMEEIAATLTKGQRVMITTLTKRMAEELNKYLENSGVRCSYIHSDVDSLTRIEIMDKFREGIFDVLIGVNLLREGLDFPDVSLVMIMDADKEGFLRSERSLIQTAGRAARNPEGRVLMFADRITMSMQKTINQTNRRREKQQRYNEKHGITPTQAGVKRVNDATMKLLQHGKEEEVIINASDLAKISLTMAAEARVEYQKLDLPRIRKDIDIARSRMEAAAKIMDFVTAQKERDVMLALQKLIE